jgi:SAM-dependent methyltransferase
MTGGSAAVDTSNFAKYQTTNPLVRRLIDGFFGRLAELVAPLAPTSVLDAGCGEGETLARLAHLLPRDDVFAVDILDESVEFTRRRLPFVNASRESVHDLPFEDDRFDLVLSLEVLEHLDRPGEGLAELDRVARRALIVSVPFEPYFRLGSLARGKYVGTWGNHPEHVNHWNRRTFRRFLEPRVRVDGIAVAFPWLIARCGPQ